MKTIAIVGPTASAKSDVAMRLCERLQGEIVSCDSVQVYRAFSIGSAKATLAEQARVPHHLIDVAEWFEAFDAERYRREAKAAILDIQKRGRVPVVCGGTGLYLRALRFGLLDVPPGNPALREEWMAEERLHPGTLYQRLVRLDPETARRIPPNNFVHILRAIEISEAKGVPASQLRAQHGFAEEETPMQVFYLARRPEELRARVIARTHAMLKAGWIEEVSHLLANGVLASARPMSAVGYREIASVLLGEKSAEGLEDRIAASTWQYARRQRTWFRREKDICCLDAARPVDELCEVIQAQLISKQN